MRKNYRPYILELVLTLAFILVFCLCLSVSGTVLKIISAVVLLSFAVICIKPKSLLTDLRVLGDIVTGKTVTDTVTVKKVSVYSEKVMLEKWGRDRSRVRFYDYLVETENGEGIAAELIVPEEVTAERRGRYRVTYGKSSHVVLSAEAIEPDE